MSRRKKLVIIEIISTILFMISIILIIVNGFKSFGEMLGPGKYILKPLTSVILMGIAAYFTHLAAITLIGSKLIAMALSIGVAAVIYFASIFLLKVLTEDEVIQLPSGVKLLKLLKKIGFYK